MRVLAICNTYYQILVCLKMRLSVLRNDFMDIVISDQCGVVKGIADRLCASEVFDRVYFKSTKAMAMGKDTIFGKVHDVRQVIFGNPEFADVCGTYYDKLLFNNTDIVVHMFYASLEKLNPNIRCARFEEGILSYNNFFQSFSKLEMSRVCRKLLHKSNLLERIDEFYCFTPEAYCGDSCGENSTNSGQS